MNKKEYIETLSNLLSQSVNGEIYINITKLAEILGVSRETAALYVHKLKFLRNGKEKLFFIHDVAITLYNNLKCES